MQSQGCFWAGDRGFGQERQGSGGVANYLTAILFAKIISLLTIFAG
jgi:hypothetical protein